MKNVLIIGNFWPYIDSGSIRVIGLYRFLPKYGYNPIILTGKLLNPPDHKLKDVHEVHYKHFLIPETSVRQVSSMEIVHRHSHIHALMKKIYVKLKELFAYPDEHKAFISPAIAKAEEIIKERDISAVISIYPVSTHSVAYEIKKRYNIPWIVDIPDLWSHNQAYPYGKTRQKRDEKYEKKVLQSADAITTVTPQFIDIMDNLSSKGKTTLITHGFDPETLNSPPKKLNDKFTITYTGYIYDQQNPLLIAQAFKELVEEGKVDEDDIQINFWGPHNLRLDEYLKKYSLDFIQQKGKIPREQAIQEQRKSHLLLLLKWEDKRQKGILTSKIFEYFAALRPIIATGGFPDVVDDFLKKTQAGQCTSDVESLKKTVLSYYEVYKKGKDLPYSASIQRIKEYSLDSLTGKFVKLIDTLDSRKNSHR